MRRASGRFGSIDRQVKQAVQGRIVSSEDEELILVDESDNEIGYLSKAKSHDGQGRLHRAFSVFVFDSDGRLLLPRRAKGKRLWPGFWSNSCCSHPRRGETMQIATARRLQEELGIQVALEYVYRFRYQVTYDETGSEHELCSVYLGRCDQTVQANRTEIDEVRFVSAADLRSEMQAQPDAFTPWFKQEWGCLTNEHGEILGRYLRSG